MAVEHCSSSDAVEVLIANGADINALNDDSQTALFLATSGSQPYTASLLLKAGITLQQPGHYPIISSINFLPVFNVYVYVLIHDLDLSI